MLLRLGSLLLAVSLAVPAAAAPRDTARAHYEAGTKHYALSELDEALVDFKEAYRLKPDPVFLYNIAQCHRRLNHTDEAAEFYRSYLRELPKAPNRADVERILAELDTQIAAKQEAARAAEQERARQAALAAAPAPAPVAVIEAPTPPPKKPLVKKPWFWVAVVGGAGVVATAVALGVVFGTSHDPHAQLGTVTFGGK